MGNQLAAVLGCVPKRDRLRYWRGGQQKGDGCGIEEAGISERRRSQKKRKRERISREEAKERPKKSTGKII